MTGFVNRINTANQSVETFTVRHCGVYQNKTIRCGVCSIYGGKEGIERSINDIIVDYVFVYSRSHSENLKIPMQNPFSKPLIDSKRKEFQKSEIGLQIER